MANAYERIWLMELWTCPGGEQWDRFLLEPAGAKNEELSRHLENCPYCQFLVAKRKQFFEALKQTWEQPAGSRVIYLFPLETSHALAAGSELLAAQGESGLALSQSLLLSSPDRTMSMVAVRDQRSGELWLYLRADDPALVQNVLVRPFGGSKEYLTDDAGRINLGPVGWPAPDSFTAEVRLAKTVFTLTPFEPAGPEPASTFLSSPLGDRIRVALSDTGSGRRLEIEPIHLTGIAEDLPLKVAVREGRKEGILLIKQPEEKKLSVEGIQAYEPVEIFFFQ